MSSAMGSYTVYGGAAAANIAIQKRVEDDPTLIATNLTMPSPDALAPLDPISHYVSGMGIDGLIVRSGHIYLDGVSITDIGTTLLVILTITATLIRAWYDFNDWRDKRKINKVVMDRACAGIKARKDKNKEDNN